MCLHVVGAQASVLVLEKVERAVILSRQMGVRCVLLQLVPQADHRDSQQDALRTNLKHSRCYVCRAAVHERCHDVRC